LKLATISAGGGDMGDAGGPDEADGADAMSHLLGGAAGPGPRVVRARALYVTRCVICNDVGGHLAGTAAAAALAAPLPRGGPAGRGGAAAAPGRGRGQGARRRGCSDGRGGGAAAHVPAALAAARVCAIPGTLRPLL